MQALNCSITQWFCSCFYQPTYIHWCSFKLQHERCLCIVHRSRCCWVCRASLRTELRLMYANTRAVESRFAWPTNMCQRAFFTFFSFFSFFSIPFFSLVIFTISFLTCCLTNPSVLGYLISTKITEQTIMPQKHVFRKCLADVLLHCIGWLMVFRMLPSG
jgi:hypothetical protein